MDIPRYAKSLIERFGSHAGSYAQTKANAYLAVGDDHEAAVWEEIVRVVAELNSSATSSKKQDASSKVS